MLSTILYRLMRRGGICKWFASEVISLMLDWRDIDAGELDRRLIKIGFTRHIDSLTKRRYTRGESTITVTINWEV